MVTGDAGQHGVLAARPVEMGLKSDLANVMIRPRLIPENSALEMINNRQLV